MRSLEQSASLDTGHASSETPSAANEGNFVSLEDLGKRGTWENNDGRIRVESVDPPVIMDYASGRQVFLENPEALRKKLEEGKYGFLPAPEGEVASTISAPEAPHNFKEEIETLDTAVETTLENIEQRAKELVSALEKAQEEAGKTDSQAIAARLHDIEELVKQELEKVDDLSEQDDESDQVLKGKEATLEDVTTKQTRLSALEATHASFGNLLQEVEGFTEALITLSTEREREETVGDQDPSHDEAPGTQEKQRKKNRKGGSGGDGGDGGDETDKGEKKKQKRAARLLEKAERQQATGVPVAETETTEIPQEEVSSADLAWRKELDAFLERPEGLEVIKTYRQIIQGEWQMFFQIVGKSVSWEEKIDMWEQDSRLLPKVRTRILQDLQMNRGLFQKQSEEVFAAVLKELDSEFQEKKIRKQEKRDE